MLCLMLHQMMKDECSSGLLLWVAFVERRIQVGIGHFSQRVEQMVAYPLQTVQMTLHWLNY